MSICGLASNAAAPPWLVLVLEERSAAAVRRRQGCPNLTVPEKFEQEGHPSPENYKRYYKGYFPAD